ncbi:MAG: DUF1292 domain-containing protein [Vampirovibrio sp.]|nr:DUF1292 domain-containing protein [Vampirovibrio sp.]
MTTNGRMTSEIIETADEEGNVHVFEKIDDFELDGQHYALLIYQGGGEHDNSTCGNPDHQPEPAAKKEGEGEEEGYEEELVVMRIIKDGDGDMFEAIEDEAEFQKISKYLEENMEILDDEELVLDLEELAAGLMEENEPEDPKN